MNACSRFVIALAIVVGGVPAGAAGSSPTRFALGDPIFHPVADARALPENVVSGIAQDKAGFLWIGTPDGAVRYDGHTFRTFRNDTGDAHSLAENHVRKIHGARDGRVWIATGGGASVFDPATERFDNVLLGESVYAFADGEPGQMFVAGSGGLRRVDERTLAATPLDAMPRGVDRPDRNKVIALLRDRRGRLWIGSVDGLALRGADGTVDVVALPHAGGPEQVTQPVDRIFEARDGAIWIGRLSGDINRIDPETLAVLPVPDVRRARSFALAQFEDETIWVGTASNGIEVRDAATGALRARFRHDASVAESLASDSVRTLFVDRSGVLWIGTAGKGLARYNPADAAFGLLRHSPRRPDGLSDEEVRALFESSDGLLWVGTHDNGVDVFDATRRVAAYRPGNGEDQLENGTVRSIAETGDGAIWFGTYGMVDRLDRASGRIERIRVEPFGSVSMRVQHLLPTADGSGLWVGTTAGLALLDVRNRTWTPVLFEDGREVRHDITDLAYDADGALWVATTSRVAVLPAGATRFVELSNGRNTGGTLPAGTALSLLLDRKDRVWLGMSTGLVRLLQFDGRTARFEQVAPRLGLANRRCDNLNEDLQGQIWIEEKARFDPDTYAVRFFGVDEGAGRSTWHGVSLRTRSGQLMLGTTDGLFVVDPARVRAWTYAPPVVLTGVQVDGHALPAERRSLVLTPDNASVGFEFAALDYSAPDRNRYAYRLLGFDRGWTEIDGGRRSASYTALPPGHFTFEVRGSNREGRFSDQVVSLPVSVLPAFHQTAWFKLAAAMLLLGLVWSLYQMRLRALAERQHELEQTVAARTGELRRSEQRANEASQAKSVFLANMSHELRTPLNAVLGFARLMRRSATLGTADRDNLAIIERSGEHLLALINQVLSIAKIESGAMTLDTQGFDPHVALDTIAKMIRNRAEHAELDFTVDIDPGLPHALRGDVGKLRQALLNLLGNAVKFTRAGGVRLGVQWDDGRMRFEVADTGPGIAADELPALFEPFAQTATGRAAQEGTGLGLAITRRIVELMGGTITVDSTVGVGTTFRFDALFEVCEQLPATAEGPSVVRLIAPQPAPRVAVVDDTEENRALLVNLLQAVGFEVRSAINGAEGIALWHAWQPALLFMDLRMPVMDGQAAVRRIRAEEAAQVQAPVKVVALTASVFEAEAGVLRAAGFDDVIFKPYRESAIFGALERLIDVRFEYERAEPLPTATDGPVERPLTGTKWRVLLADDDGINRAVAQNALEDAGFDVIESSDGVEALQVLERTGQVDLVLLDVEMPRMGGVATVRRIRAQPQHRHLPVLALTAHSDPLDLARLVEAGMDGHIVKPFDPDALAEAVSTWIARARERRG